MFNTTIQSVTYCTTDSNLLQASVLFDDGNGNTFTKNYTYTATNPEDLVNLINNDVATYNVAGTALTTAPTDIQTAIANVASTITLADSFNGASQVSPSLED